LQAIGRHMGALLVRLPVRMPVLVPSLPVQFIHEDDVGLAFLLCVVGAGPPGAYNITGDGVLTGDEVARELGLASLALPARPVQAAARTLARCAALAAVHATDRRVARSRQSAVGHGRDQGQARARLAAPLYERPGPTPNAPPA
jgi:hypothetical protein